MTWLLNRILMGQNYFISACFWEYFLNLIIFWIFLLKSSINIFSKHFYFFKTNTYSGYYWFLYSAKLKNFGFYKLII